MLKAYVLGLSSVSLAALLVIVIWMFGTQPRQEPGLLWGGQIYTTKQEFNGYLKSKGLSYKTWVARNPDAAPWEPEELTIGPITVRASAEARENWVVRLPLAAIGVMFATGCGFLLLRGLHSRGALFARKSAALFSVVATVVLIAGLWFGTQPQTEPEPGLSWGGKVYTTKQELNGYLSSKGLSYESWLARNPNAAPWERDVEGESTKVGREWTVGWPLLIMGLVLAVGMGVMLSHAVRPSRSRLGIVAHLTPLVVRIRPVLAASTGALPSLQRLGTVASAVIRRVKVVAPVYRARLIHAARADARQLPKLMENHSISVGYLVFGLLAAVVAGTLAVFVVSLLSP
jgi:hypothetical protein